MSLITNTPETSEVSESAELTQRARSGAQWFYWVAALTLITSAIALSGSEWRFFLSLGFTQVIDELANLSDTGFGRGLAFALDLIVAGAFALFGLMAVRGQGWAFVLGMALFGLDALIFVLGQDWIGVAFHAFVLFAMMRGYQAHRKLTALRDAGPAYGGAQ